MTSPPASSCVKEIRLHGACTLVVLCGEIDIHTAPGISWHLDALTHAGDTDLLIDLRPVEFIDGAGVRLLNRARARTGGRHGRLRLICTRRATLHLLNHPRLRLDFAVLSELPAPTPPEAAA
ncbi:STAS domain-containing protein [Streptomyces sp. NPDC051597]|uniref:STAS domain-containing protein n=1 Tax=Streptomyces sp. NPDC051597 TaxID=3155049 RepID=UPI0034431745